MTQVLWQYRIMGSLVIPTNTNDEAISAFYTEEMLVKSNIKFDK